MKPHELIKPWKGDKRFTAIAKQAAALKKDGKDADEIMTALVAEFGAPTAPVPLRDTPQPYTVFGSVGTGAEYDIEPHALAQLELALRLPVAIRGALMPDAHPGYALPVGGVFAAHRAVAPAMVGVDIGCRMHLTVLDLPADELLAQRAQLLKDLQAVTVFGVGVSRPRTADHDVLDDPRWNLTNQLRGLRTKAVAQLGTSGAGNHFAELVIGERLPSDVDAPGVANVPQRFAALLTHSGSRGIGYAVANAYGKLAAQETERRAAVPKMYEWLDLDGEAGQEYWQAMELAGAFAQANHEVIHAAFLRRAKLDELAVVQNHHNFAWLEGDVVIHRKGATPARVGELGIIPGSMASNSYLVAGRGNPDALSSASHGAGRRGSRTQARATINPRDAQKLLREKDVLVEGFSIDESPMAYKNIEQVMNVQVNAGLITPLARMRPVAVIMGGEPGED